METGGRVRQGPPLRASGGTTLPGGVVAWWIRTQRDALWRRGRALSPEERAGMSGWFGPRTLERVRIVRSDGREAGSRPGLAGWLTGVPLHAAGMAGITYGDVVFLDARRVPARLPAPLLCHELVHVVQYDLLGIRGFAERYVEGWIRGGYRYRAIPLEVEAYRIDAAYRLGRSPPPGGVEHFVAERLARC